MSRALLRGWLILLIVAGMGQTSRAAQTNFTLVVHGGAGVWRRELPPERETQARGAMRAALEAGHNVLRTNGTSLDAVEAAIRILEDAPVFNAGVGSVLNSEGAVEMDASIMRGTDLKAGAVASVRRIQNPISAARAVMERSPHVMLVGEGAEEFARERGLKLVSPRTFITPFRREQWQRAREQERTRDRGRATGTSKDVIGTVGAVALDARGHLAAGTSTGGMLNKKFGRVGDSPIIGAGTYADNETCAVSATGHGEFFIRSVVAHDVSALRRYRGDSLRTAAEEVIRKVGRLGGTGGVIAIDGQGNVAMPFNTEGMFRGVIRADGSVTMAVFPD